MIGRTLGHYRVDARIGAGGMGVVYRAYHARLQRTVALKVVKRDPAFVLEDDQILEEARTASGLNHPNICTVYEVAEIDGDAFIAMEHVAGRPLSELIPEGGLPCEGALRYATEIAAALAHAHDRGVIHRDLKSANVVISTEGRPDVASNISRFAQEDFGRDVRRRAGDGSSGIVPAGAGIGARRQMNPASDPEIENLRALGVLMFEMATGAMPFSGRNQFDLTRVEADAERLYVAPSTGGDARLLTRTPGAVARWSPDGELIAFAGTRGLTGGVFVIAADGQNERRLTSEGGWPVWWSGKGIAFLAPTPGGGQEIRVVSLLGGSPTVVDTVTFMGGNHPFDVSRSGGLLVTSNGVHVSNELWLLEPRK